MRRQELVVAITLVAFFPACSDERAADSSGDEGLSSETSTETLDGGEGPHFDVSNDEGGTEAGDGDGDCDDVLVAVVRDFQIAHPDFEYVIEVDPGIVQAMIGGDQKPVYAGNPTTPTTNGQEFFDQWYRDVDGVNLPFVTEMPLTDNGDGTYTFVDPDFFPIDDQGFGNEGNPHNYHFTLELHTEFVYEGGEIFEFTGDDDLFTFVNGQLAIDLGGVHGALNGQVDLDQVAAQFGLELGQTYPLDFFFAERHTSESNFRIDTTIGCITVPPIG